MRRFFFNLQGAQNTSDPAGLLYAGDCKMSALDTRAHLARHEDYYLVPLPQTGEVPESFGAWIENYERADQCLVVAQKKYDQTLRQLDEYRGGLAERLVCIRARLVEHLVPVNIGLQDVGKILLQLERRLALHIAMLDHDAQAPFLD